MAIDGVCWDDANKVCEKMYASNQSGAFLVALPYQIGMVTAVVGAFASIPLCFDLNTVAWFNEHYVTTDRPPAEDLETCLEVGSWAWGWMEPPLGQISFFLLALQFARAQMENLGIKPYTGLMKSRRANALCAQYPKYSAQIVKDFSKGQSLL
jgi:hypothetical protein